MKIRILTDGNWLRLHAILAKLDPVLPLTGILLLRFGN
jgi:hypothetical protein